MCSYAGPYKSCLETGRRAKDQDEGGGGGEEEGTIIEQSS